MSEFFQRALASETVTITLHALDEDGVAITGANDFLIALLRTSDDDELDFDDDTFKSSPGTDTQALDEVDATNHPGLYSYDLVLPDITNIADEADTYHIAYSETGSDLLFKPAGQIIINPPDLMDIAYDKAIHVSPDGTFGDTGFGVNGLRSTPVGQWSDVLTLLDNTGYTRVIFIRPIDPITLAATLDDTEMRCLTGTQSVDTASEIFRGCEFTYIEIDGATNAASSDNVYRDCSFVTGAALWSGDRAYSCELQGVLGVNVGALLVDCYAQQGATARLGPSISFGGNINCIGFRGNLEIGDYSTFAPDIAINMLQGQLTLRAGNDQGAFVVSGTGRLVNSVTGTATVNEDGWQEGGDVSSMAADVITASALATDAVAEIVSAAWDKVMSGNHDSAGSAGALLQLAAVGVDISIVQGLLLDASRGAVSTDTFNIKEGDLLPVIATTLKDGAVAKDLTGHTVEFRRKNIDTGAVEIDDATVVDAESGSVKYTWQSGDTDTPGRYYTEWIVTKDVTLEKTTYPGVHYQNLVIGAILA